MWISLVITNAQSSDVEKLFPSPKSQKPGFIGLDVTAELKSRVLCFYL
jgi:hypothetical protein